MSAYGVLPSRPITPHTQFVCSQCGAVSEFPTPNPIPPPNTQLRIRCCHCSSIVTHTTSTSATSWSTAEPNGTPRAPQRRSRKIGTDENPLETGYYEILGVPVNASTDDIKKAYRRLAIKHHPDKNRDDPNAEERFKLIGIAYQTLSDPTLRHKYNEFGSKESAPEGGFMDPEEIFGSIFGGERFVTIIGHISLAKDMKAALQEADEEGTDGGTGGDGRRVLGPDGKEIVSPEEKARKEEKERKQAAEKAKAREERVAKLVETLGRKLSIFTESAASIDDQDVTRSWKTICALEAEDLKNESYGVELLHTIGFVYAGKARHYLASNQTFMGVGGWLHNVQGKYHVFSETVSTVRAAIEVKQVFDQIQAAERSGLTPEQRKKLEEQAAEKGLRALFKGAKLEIESVLREVCDRILTQTPHVSRYKLLLRATAMEMLGVAYMNVQKDGEAALEEAEKEYVRVDTQGSKARDHARASGSGRGQFT